MIKFARITQPVLFAPVFFALGLSLISAAPASATELAGTISCPPVLSFQAMPEAPYGWLPNPAKDVAAFKEGRLIKAEDRAKLGSLPLPDGVAADRVVRRARSATSQWSLNGTRAPHMILLCLYQDTSASVALELPRSIRRCDFTSETDDRGNRRDRAERPAQFVCR